MVFQTLQHTQVILLRAPQGRQDLIRHGVADAVAKHPAEREISPRLLHQLISIEIDGLVLGSPFLEVAPEVTGVDLPDPFQSSQRLPSSSAVARSPGSSWRRMLESRSTPRKDERTGERKSRAKTSDARHSALPRDSTALSLEQDGSSPSVLALTIPV